MNLEKVTWVGPSYPQDIDLVFCAHSKCLQKHPDYEISEWDILIYIVGRFPDELTAVPVGVYTPHAGTGLLRIGVFNPDTFRCQTNGLYFHTTHYLVIGLYNS